MAFYLQPGIFQPTNRVISVCFLFTRGPSVKRRTEAGDQGPAREQGPDTSHRSRRSSQPELLCLSQCCAPNLQRGHNNGSGEERTEIGKVAQPVGSSYKWCKLERCRPQQRPQKEGARR
ncbi:hypothetical protein FKM82_017777 [Ascaphus truei]